MLVGRLLCLDGLLGGLSDDLSGLLAASRLLHVNYVFVVLPNFSVGGVRLERHVLRQGRVEPFGFFKGVRGVLFLGLEGDILA